MRLSTKGRYGVRAVVDLALHSLEGPIPIRDISKREGISTHYVEQLFNKLKRSGLIRSVRGPWGGYLLAKKPSEIKIGDILRVLEGSLAPVFCVNPEETKRRCPREEACLTRALWRKLANKITEILDGTTIEDLCKQKRTESKRRNG